MEWLLGSWQSQWYLIVGLPILHITNTFLFMLLHTSAHLFHVISILVEFPACSSQDSSVTFPALANYIVQPIPCHCYYVSFQQLFPSTVKLKLNTLNYIGIVEHLQVHMELFWTIYLNYMNMALVQVLTSLLVFQYGLICCKLQVHYSHFTMV